MASSFPSVKPTDLVAEFRNCGQVSGHRPVFVSAWQEVQGSLSRTISLARVQYVFDKTPSPDLLVILNLLDSVRSGFFHAVFFVSPPAAPWSRSRLSGTEDQKLLSLRAQRSASGGTRPHSPSQPLC